MNLKKLVNTKIKQAIGVRILIVIGCIFATIMYCIVDFINMSTLEIVATFIGLWYMGFAVSGFFMCIWQWEVNWDEWK